MPLATTTGSLVIVDLNTPAPQVFWKGDRLTQVVGVKAKVDEDDTRIVLRVQNTTDFDSAYFEMIEAGIQIKKVR